MLKHLYINNFILIDEVQLDFESGFSVFTGETGAGKSILIDALGLLTNDRASPSMVKKGKESSLIEGVFDLRSSHSRPLLEEEGFDCEEDVVISREIRADGKNIVKINYRVVTLALLKHCLKDEIDIHSQHDHQYLLNKSSHLSLLDRFIQSETPKKCLDVFKVFKEKKEALDRAENEEFNQDDLEFYQFQLNEIDDAKLSIEEEEQLVQQEKKYNGFSKNLEKYQQAITLYDENVDGPLYEIKKIIESVVPTEVTDRLLEKLNTLYFEFNDSFDELKEYCSSLNDEDINIDQIQERLFEIQRLKRKYGPSVEFVLAKADEFKEKINLFEHRQEVVSKLKEELDQAQKDYLAIATVLTMERKKAAIELDQLIIKNLRDLELPHAQFKTSIEPASIAHWSGMDDVEFLISMNPGEDLKSLSKVASGGELSRLMLGLKTIFTKLQGIQTVIFDEIDTGVSGSTATAIGLKMRELSKSAQVFSVTHLAQVAACSNQHYHVQKEQAKDSTKTIISKLNTSQRIENLAWIASGETTEATLSAAKELFTKNQKGI